MQEIISRSNIYALLSRIMLQELDEELVELFKKDPVVLEFFTNWSEWELKDSKTAKELLEENLNPDFVNLSLLHLIPYETFYTRADQMIESGGANPVTDIYSAYGFTVDFEAARVVSPDHIGIELEFMHHLCESHKKALQEGNEEMVREFIEIEHRFLNTHLLKWAPLYLISMKYESRTPIYYDAADMAIEFILSDNELLTKQVNA